MVHIVSLSLLVEDLAIKKINKTKIFIIGKISQMVNGIWPY